MRPEPRLLVFAPAFPPLGNPEAIVNGKLVLALLDAGWHVDVIARDLSRESGYDYGSAWVEPWLRLRDRVHVVRYASAGLLRRAAETLGGALRTGHFLPGCRWAAQASREGERRHAERPYDLVLSRSGPDSAHLAALAFARRTGVPWVANWNDPCREKMPPPYGPGPAGRVGVSYERFIADVARTARAHVFPSERQRRYMCGYLGGIAEARSHAIPHAGLGRGPSAPRPAGGFVICHAGRLTPERSPETFLRGLQAFLARCGPGAPVRFRVVGLEDVGLAAMAAELGVGDRVEFEGARGYLETLDEVAAGQVALVVEAPCDEGIFLPSKLVDYAEAGRPVLAVSPRVGTLADLLGSHGGGIAVDCLSAGAVADALGTLYESWRAGELESRYRTGGLAALFAPEVVARRYGALLEGVARGAAAGGRA